MSLITLYNQLGRLVSAPLLKEGGEPPSYGDVFARGRLVSTDKRVKHTQATVELLEQTGAVLVAAGKRAEGAVILSSAMAWASSSLGADHPSTDRIIRSLAATYNQLGFFSHAAPLYELLLYQSEKSKGESHEDTLECVSALARYNFNRQDFERALPLYERLLKAIWKEEGPNSTNTALRAIEYAHAFTALDDRERALIWYERATSVLVGKTTLPDAVALTHFQIASRLKRHLSGRRGLDFAKEGYLRLKVVEPPMPSKRWVRIMSLLQEMAIDNE